MVMQPAVAPRWQARLTNACPFSLSRAAKVTCLSPAALQRYHFGLLPADIPSQAALACMRSAGGTIAANAGAARDCCSMAQMKTGQVQLRVAGCLQGHLPTHLPVQRRLPLAARHCLEHAPTGHHPCTGPALSGVLPSPSRALMGQGEEEPDPGSRFQVPAANPPLQIDALLHSLVPSIHFRAKHSLWATCARARVCVCVLGGGGGAEYRGLLLVHIHDHLTLEGSPCRLDSLEAASCNNLAPDASQLQGHAATGHAVTLL